MFTSSRLLNLGLLIVLTAVLGLGRSELTQAQARQWSEPIQVSPPGQFAWFPDIAVDLSGQLHLVYASGVLGNNRAVYDSVMYSISSTGDTWSVPNDIFSLPQPGLGESAATRPTLFVDRFNYLHIAFTDYFRMYYSQVFSPDGENAGAWAPNMVMSTGGQSVYFGKVFEDAAGRLSYIFTENVYSAQCPACYHLYYRYSDDSGQKWSAPVDVSRALTGVAKPQAIVDSQGNYHIVWDSGRGGALGGVLSPITARYSASYDRGQTWTFPIDFTTPVSSSSEITPETRHITIGNDGQNKIVVVWLSMPDEVVYYQVSSDQGRSWSTPTPIPGILGGLGIINTPTDSYALATSADGTLHLALVGRRDLTQKTLEVLHLTWNGATWSKPETVVSYSGDVPEWPRLAVRNGNELHLVWFVRNREAVFGSESRTASYRVWYSRATLDAPAATPRPALTRVPSLTPTVSSTSAATALAVPTAAPTLSGPLPTPSNIGIYRENDYLLIAAQSALPVVGVLAIAGILIWLRRR